MTLHDLTINFVVATGFALLPLIDIALWLQIGSYSASMIVGGITIYKFFKRK